MNAKASLVLDSRYFELMYAESLRYRTYYRRIAVPISIAIVALGIVIAVIESLRLLGILILSIGFVDLVETTTHRERWLKKVMSAERSKTAEIHFTDTAVQIDSDYSHGWIDYGGLQSAVATPRGLFLIPHAGISMFIPLATIEPQGLVDSLVAHVLTKVNRSK